VQPATHHPGNPGGGLGFAHAVSTSADLTDALDEITEQLGAISPPDLLMIFISAHHAEDAALIGTTLGRALKPGLLLGTTADTVIAGGRELERTPSISVLAAHLPGVTLRPFISESLEHSGASGPDAEHAMRDLIGASPQLRATILFADPFSTPMTRLLPLLNAARVPDRSGRPAGAIIGGLASAGAKAGENTLLLNNRLTHTGFVGVSLSGPIRVDAVVSQGCRAIGDNMIITKAKNNVIYELGSRPALDVLRDLLDTLGDRERDLLKRGLFVGRVVSEYKDNLGRGDYLIRNVAGVNPKTNFIAVHDLVRVGQTVRFHIRDAQTAEEDLELLLNAQQLYGPPAGVLLITCTGRGRNLFDHPNHDADTIQRAFEESSPGVEQAKPGQVFNPTASGIPLAGFFAAGEIGPVGDATYLHGHSACAVMFRE
jgi:small ligand-binding sensory domain FIST